MEKCPSKHHGKLSFKYVLKSFSIIKLLSKVFHIKTTISGGTLRHVLVLFKTSPKTLFQIFLKIILNYQVIVKSITGPDDNFWRDSEACVSIIQNITENSLTNIL